MIIIRRQFHAFLLFVVFAGLAGAQVQIGPITGVLAGPFSCGALVGIPPGIRTEGTAEKVGEMVLTCTGGPAPVPGAVVPTAEIRLALPSAVTSRILPAGGSEAILLIDEPGTSPINQGA